MKVEEWICVHVLQRNSVENTHVYIYIYAHILGVETIESLLYGFIA